MRGSIFLLLVLFYFPALAQDFSIHASAVDTESKPLPGAHISLLHPWDEVFKTTISEANGSFEIKEVGKGGYKIKVSFLGYLDLVQEVNILSEDLNLGNLVLQEGSTDLAEIEVLEKIPLAQQLGDTTQYNADAFKTLPDADAQELIEKMPGVVIENGKIQAQGEDVKQVLVDGKPFFGQDPNAALKTLPAEVISKIQIFDQSSDQANFTGFNNGETTKTINIITRPNMRNGQFGKIYGGYGYEDRYQFGGNASLFDGKRRISIIGQSNNLNIQNFATDDLLGVVGGNSGRGGRGGRRGGGRRGGRGGGGSVNDFLVEQQGGIAETQAIGLNYSDKWGADFEISGSYFFNYSDNVLEENALIDYIDRADITETYQEDNFSQTNNLNHRLNLKMDYKIDSLNSIIIQPRLTFQMNDGFENTIASTLFGNEILNETVNNFSTDLEGLDFSNSVLFRHRFKGSRRTFSVNLRNGYNKNSGDSNLDFNGIYFQNMVESDTAIIQLSDLDVSGWNLSSEFTFTEPIGEQSTLMFTYRASYEQDDSDKKTFDYSNTTQEFDEINNQLTNVFENSYVRHQAGLGYNWRRGREFFFMTRANAQWATLNGNSTFPTTFQIDQNYFNILPMVMLRLNFSRQENLRVGYFSSTRQPSVAQLQNVIDNSNPLRLSIGNPDLDQTFSHRLFARYSKNNTEKATVFYAMITGTLTNNNVSNAVYLRENDNPIFENISLEPGVQLTRAVNLDGDWNVRSFVTYGFPLKAIKTNLNIDLTASFLRQPGLINDRLNYSNNQSYGTGLTFSSNISKRFDFTISSRTKFNTIKNTLQNQNNQDTEYWSQNSRIRLGWVAESGFVLRTNMTHRYYRGLSDDFNQNYILWTLGIGKKLFENERGEITLSVFDILNQNQSVSQSITETYVEEIQTNVLTRYAMLKFTYNFRNFKTKKKVEERGERGERRHGMGRW